MPGHHRGGRDLTVGAPVTFVDHARPDGIVVRWESRRHRKHQKPAAGSTWWAPGARGWWIAVLFAIGSLLFALGSVPGYSSAVGARWDTVTYFVGSLFFTSASFLSYREAIDAAPEAANPAHRHFFTYQPGRVRRGYWRAVRPSDGSPGDGRPPPRPAPGRPPRGPRRHPSAGDGQ